MLRILLGIGFSSWLALLALPAFAEGGPAPVIPCAFAKQGSTAALTTLIATAATQQNINVCGFSFAGGAAAGTFQLESGGGTTCGTSTTAITPAYTVAIGQAFADHSPIASYSIPAGANLCVVTTGTGPTGWIVYYSQF